MAARITFRVGLLVGFLARYHRLAAVADGLADQTSEAGEGVEGYGGGRGDVQRVDPFHHRDGDHHVGRCQSRIGQARPLCAEEHSHTDRVI
jgi:hypothetical protein